MKSVTFDEADINDMALRSARNALIRVWTSSVSDLNQLTPELLDKALTCALLAYNAHIVRDQFGVTCTVFAAYKNTEIPF